MVEEQPKVVELDNQDQHKVPAEEMQIVQKEELPLTAQQVEDEKKYMDFLKAMEM